MNNITLKYALEIIDSPIFQQLQKIGGGRQYHQEGSAFVHSLLVFNNSLEFWQDSPMNIIALLHDIGKIYTGRQKENGDWEYPNHCKVGAEHLLEFLPEELVDNEWFIRNANFYISNHIKPLFWKEYPEHSIENENLARLAICDLRGSYPCVEEKENQRKKIILLQKFLES